MDDREYEKAQAAFEYYTRELKAAEAGVVSAHAKVDAENERHEEWLAVAERAVVDAEAALASAQADLDAARSALADEQDRREMSGSRNVDAGTASATGGAS